MGRLGDIVDRKVRRLIVSVALRSSLACRSACGAPRAAAGGPRVSGTVVAVGDNGIDVNAAVAACDCSNCNDPAGRLPTRFRPTPIDAAALIADPHD
jgi:hypothetical protein